MANYVDSLVERERARSKAIEADASSRDSADLAGMWQALIEGKLAIVDDFSNSERHFLVLRSVAADVQARKLTARQLSFLQRLLLGQPQKGVAIDYRLSASTVAVTLSTTLHALGLSVSASRAPLLLSLMLHAHLGRAPLENARVSTFDDGQQVLRAVSSRRLDEVVGWKLSPAEQVVVRLRTDGRSHAEIATIRRTSRRTIANQLASASRKLGVSGRSELMSYLSRAASPPRPEQQPGKHAAREPRHAL